MRKTIGAGNGLVAFDVAEPRRRIGRRHPKQHEGLWMRFEKRRRRLFGEAENAGKFNHVIGRHHEHDGLGVVV